jgi:hypothetical protein
MQEGDKQPGVRLLDLKPGISEGDDMVEISGADALQQATVGGVTAMKGDFQVGKPY